MGRRKGLETDHLPLGWGPPCLHRIGPRVPSPAAPRIRAAGCWGSPLWSVLGRLRGWCVPVGHPPGCPAPRAIGGGCSGPVSRPVLQLRVLLGCLPIAGV